MIKCGKNSWNAPSFKAFWADEDGATAIEYGLIVALIFLAILTGVNAFATRSNDMYSNIQSSLAG
ncbi:MAG: Flp family type IVb pilin [Parvularculaceae bacterium]